MEELLLIVLIIIGVAIVGATWFFVDAADKLCQRLDRIAAAWEKDDDDDPSDDWKKEKV